MSFDITLIHRVIFVSTTVKRVNLQCECLSFKLNTESQNCWHKSLAVKIILSNLNTSTTLFVMHA